MHPHIEANAGTFEVDHSICPSHPERQKCLLYFFKPCHFEGDLFCKTKAYESNPAKRKFMSMKKQQDKGTRKVYEYAVWDNFGNADPLQAANLMMALWQRSGPCGTL